MCIDTLMHLCSTKFNASDPHHAAIVVAILANHMQEECLAEQLQVMT